MSCKLVQFYYIQNVICTVSDDVLIFVITPKYGATSVILLLLLEEVFYWFRQVMSDNIHRQTQSHTSTALAWRRAGNKMVLMVC